MELNILIISKITWESPLVRPGMDNPAFLLIINKLASTRVWVYWY